MKILIILQSEFYTEKQNQYSYDNKIELEWNLPFIPNKNDLIDIERMIDETNFYVFNLSWGVEYINYKMIDKVITPVLWLIGE